MVTLPALVLRYPTMSTLSNERFEMFLEDSVLIMGDVESRWLNFYNKAQAALIAHLVVLNDALADADGDGGAATGPVTRTDVDDVQVEFAERIWDKMPYQEADLYSTGYGQEYVRWRRMAFAGPRIA